MNSKHNGPDAQGPFNLHFSATCGCQSFPRLFKVLGGNNSFLDAVEISTWINQGYDLKFIIFADDYPDFGMPFMQVGCGTFKDIPSLKALFFSFSLYYKQKISSLSSKGFS